MPSLRQRAAASSRNNLLTGSLASCPKRNRQRFSKLRLLKAATTSRPQVFGFSSGIPQLRLRPNSVRPRCVVNLCYESNLAAVVNVADVKTALRDERTKERKNVRPWAHSQHAREGNEIRPLAKTGSNAERQGWVTDDESSLIFPSLPKSKTTTRWKRQRFKPVRFVVGEFLRSVIFEREIRNQREHG